MNNQRLTTLLDALPQVQVENLVIQKQCQLIDLESIVSPTDSQLDSIDQISEWLEVAEQYFTVEQWEGLMG